MRRIGVFLLLSFALAHALGWWPNPGLQVLDAFLYDQRLKLSMPRSLDERIVIVDVDEPSLSELGRWPWSCRKLSRLVRELVERQQVKVLGFDAVFAEPEHDFDAPAAHAPLDCPFAHAIDGQPVVLSYYFTSDKYGWQAGQLPSPLYEQGHWPQLLHWSGYGSNVEILTQAAAASGFFNAVTDLDGVVRSVPLLSAYEGKLYDSLPLAMLRVALQAPAVRLMPAGSSGQPPVAVELLGPQASRVLRLPLEVSGTVRVPFRGQGGPGSGSFEYIPAVDVLQGRLPAKQLEGRLVLLGFSAPGLMDLRVTPVGKAYPGVEIHANLLSGALDHLLVHQPYWSSSYEVGLLLIVGLVLIVWLPAMGIYQTLALGGGLTGLLLALSAWQQWGAQVDLPVASALALVVTATLIHFVLGFYFENRAKHRLAHQFASYVPPQIVQRMLSEPEQQDRVARSQELTVMFCDIEGFTSLSEAMTPADLQHMLTALLSRLSEAIIKHHGTIDKYIGDCVMAFWGAPVHDDAHARHAVEAALAIRQSIDEYNAKRLKQGLPAIGVRMGINTGTMMVGNMGTQLRRTYTVIGDAVNLAARLESLAANYGVDLLLTQATVEHVGKHAMLWQELDWVRVRGRQGRTTIHTVRGPLGASSPALQHELALWQRTLGQWRAGQFEAYVAGLEQLSREAVQPALYQHFMRRFQKRQPRSAPDWDGVAEYDKK